MEYYVVRHISGKYVALSSTGDYFLGTREEAYTFSFVQAYVTTRWHSGMTVERVD